MFGRWFTVLPGVSPAARPVATELTGDGAEVLSWSGERPWIVGRAGCDRVTSVSVGQCQVAVIGDHQVEAAELTARVRAVRPSGHWDRLLGIPGSYHLVVRDGSTVWLFGDAAGLRPVFATTCSGMVFLGSRARPLATLLGRPVPDAEYLAAQLLAPAPPLALAESGISPYQGVAALPPGAAARVDAAGVLHTEVWWTAPDDDMRADDGSVLLREALSEAVAARCGADGPVAVELSGGLDSSALSALTFEQVGPRTLNLSRAGADPANDDLRWARLMTATQPGAGHRVLATDQVPVQFDGWQEPFPLDSPGPTAASPDRARFLWQQAVDGGARVLLSGKGGDELLLPPLTYLASSPRLLTHRHLRGWAALRGTRMREVRAEAAHPGPYRAAIASALGGAMGWESGPWAPGWLSATARRRLEERLREAAASAVPLHDRPHQHASVAALRAMARWNRLQADAASTFGVRMAYPFQDRAVLDAALSVRGDHRRSPYAFKPLLTGALRGSLPDQVLARRTKGGYNADDRAAARRHRRGLAALLLHDSALADHGLVDPAVLAPAVRAWANAEGQDELMLLMTLNAEVWARTAEGRPLTEGAALC
ncbi:asparagine synthase-related protein [Kitasatospora cineracea]|uniref:asparagine synthase-related protein n=1 Tax=Kitasatospora cineracea TaxID=88074 RepID=UPI00341201AD